MTQAFDWMKLAKNSTSRRDCTLLCSNVGYLVLKLFYYYLKKGPFVSKSDIIVLTPGQQGSMDHELDRQPGLHLIRI